MPQLMGPSSHKTRVGSRGFNHDSLVISPFFTKIFISFYHKRKKKVLRGIDRPSTDHITSPLAFSANPTDRRIQEAMKRTAKRTKKNKKILK